MSEVNHALDRLTSVLDSIGSLAVAVSGGVDSITLASAAHAHLGAGVTMFHAVSPAVPPAATARVERLANEHGWEVEIVDADEFNDAEYMANPVNRCFYCKRDLYGSIAHLTQDTIVSGTNLDDLSDYRPGLEAASQASVRHPFVEAKIDKAMVRQLASHLGLGQLADLPAAPCLSSRVETGIEIQPAWLEVIDRVEIELTEMLQPDTVRCRARADRISVEIDKATLAQISPDQIEKIQADVEAQWRAIGVDLAVTVDAYRMGSAFLKVLP